MEKLTWDEALATYRSAQIGEAAYVLLRSKSLKVLAITWSRIKKKLKEPGDSQNLEDLWKKVTVDYDLLCTLTGQGMLQVVNGMQQLRTLQLIFPDGSMNRLARAVIQGEVIRAIKGKEGKPEKELSDPSKNNPAVV